MDNTYRPSLSGNEMNVVISKLGIKKSNTKVWQLLLLGILAGVYIAFGGHFFLVALSEGLGKVVGGIAFSVGLVLVVIAGAELFTGNITIIVGVISGAIPLKKMLKNWMAVYAGNLLGSLAYAFLIYESGLFDNTTAPNALGAVAHRVAESKIALSFGDAFIRGIFCNMLVILAILLSAMAKDLVSKIACIIFPIACFVACGFEHCVANMFLIPIGLLAGGAGLGEMSGMAHNLIAVTLGNLVGGLAILLIHPNRIRQIHYLLQSKKP